MSRLSRAHAVRVAVSVAVSLPLLSGAATPSFAAESVQTHHTLRASAAAVQPAVTLRLYDAGTLTPAHALSLPAGVSASAAVRARIPAVNVKVTRAISLKSTLSTPPSVWAAVPANLAAKMEAYFIPMSAQTGFYLVGPRGMTGSASLAADGSFAIYLHNRSAMIELDSPGASPLTAAAMSADFFPSARAALDHSGLGLRGRPIAHTTVARPNDHTALFAFKSTGGRRVTGLDFYQAGGYPGYFGQSALMVYSATPEAWGCARWVMDGGLTVLNNIGEMQSTGKSVMPATRIVHAGGGSYGLLSTTTTGAATTRGVAWIQPPPSVQRGSVNSPHSLLPMGTYLLVQAKPHQGRIVMNSQVQLAALPWLRVDNATDEPLYDYPFLLGATGNRWIVYVESYLAYDKSGVAGNAGGISQSVWLIDLATGRPTHLPTSDVTGNAVRVKEGGRLLVIPLHPLA